MARGLRDQVVWGMGGRWKIDGRRRGGCGPGMPGPYGGWKGERVLAGNGQAEGSRPLPTVWGETGCVKQ